MKVCQLLQWLSRARAWKMDHEQNHKGRVRTVSSQVQIAVSYPQSSTMSGKVFSWCPKCHSPSRSAANFLLATVPAKILGMSFTTSFLKYSNKLKSLSNKNINHELIAVASYKPIAVLTTPSRQCTYVSLCFMTRCSCNNLLNL